MASQTMKLICVPSQLLVAVEHVLHVQNEILDGELPAEYRITLTRKEASQLAQLVGQCYEHLATTDGTAETVIIDARECEGNDA